MIGGPLDHLSVPKTPRHHPSLISFLISPVRLRASNQHLFAPPHTQYTPIQFHHRSVVRPQNTLLTSQSLYFAPKRNQISIIIIIKKYSKLSFIANSATLVCTFHVNYAPVQNQLSKYSKFNSNMADPIDLPLT